MKKKTENIETKETSTFVETNETPEEKLSFEQNIENKRKAFTDLYKKSKRFNNIVTFASLILLVAGLVMIVQTIQALQIVGWVFLGVTVVGMLLYFIFNKNKLPNATKEYINTLSAEYNNFIFNDKVFSKVTTDPKEKLDLATIASDKAYSGVSRINSRNVVKGTFNGKDPFVISDCAAYIPSDKKQEKVCFLGKYITYYNKLDIEGRIIINIQNEKPIDLPTDLEDLQSFSAGKINIYAKDEETKNKLNTKFLHELETMPRTAHMLNLCLVLWQGHTAVYLSYDDTTMTFPLQNEFKLEPISSLKEEMISILKIVDKLN